MAGCAEAVLQGETVFLDLANQKDLVRSQWPFGPKLWIGYRFVTMLYIVAVLVWALVEKFMRYQWKFFTMISHWAYVIFAVNSILKVACVIKYHKWLKEKDRSAQNDEEKPLLLESRSIFIKSNNCHCLLQLSWLVANIANVYAIMVTFTYWWPGDVQMDTVSVVNIQTHGVNMILALLDTLLVAQPTFLLHFYQPLCFELLYISFTALYYVAGGLGKEGTTYIYPSLNWEKAEDVLIDYVPFNILVTVCSHLALWLLAAFRTAVASTIKKKNMDIRTSSNDFWAM